MNTVLFVCTGNYYRSRFAEIYFNYQAQGKNLDWKAFSRGFNAANPANIGPISVHAIARLRKEGIYGLEEHNFPIRIQEEDIVKAGKVIALNKQEHKQFVTDMFPELEGKFVFWDVYDIQDEQPDMALRSIMEKIDQLIASFS